MDFMGCQKAFKPAICKTELSESFPVKELFYLTDQTILNNLALMQLKLPKPGKMN